MREDYEKRKEMMNMARYTKRKLWMQKDEQKSYHYVFDGKKEIGFFAWHYEKKIWIWHKNKEMI